MINKDNNIYQWYQNTNINIHFTKLNNITKDNETWFRSLQRIFK